MSIVLVGHFAILLVGQKSVYFHTVNTDDFKFSNVQGVAVDKIDRHWVISNDALYVIENGKVSSAKVYLSFSINDVISVGCIDDYLYILYKNGTYSEVNLLNLSRKNYYLEGAEAFEKSNDILYLKKNLKYFSLFDHKTKDIIPYKNTSFEIDNNQLIDKNNCKTLCIYTKNGHLHHENPIVDYYGRFYLVHSGTLYAFSEDVYALAEFKTSEELCGKQVRSSLPLEDGRYFVSLDEINGCYIVNQDRYTPILSLPQNISFSSKTNMGIIFHAVKAQNDKLWLLSSEKKIYKLDIKTLKIEEDERLNQFGIKYKNIYVDKLENIWIGSYTDKLLYYNPLKESIKIYDRTDCSELYDMFRIYEDQKGIIWIGMSKGFVAFNPVTESFSTFGQVITSYNQNLSQTSISAFEHDNNNRLWVGSYDHGLSYIDYNQLEKHLYSNNIKNKIEAHSLYESQKFGEENIKFLNFNRDKLIVRTANGLHVLNPKDFSIKTWTTREGFPIVMNNNYNYIEKGRYYIIGAMGGIGKIDLEYKPQKIDHSIKSIYTDGKQSALIYPLLTQKKITLSDDVSLIQAFTSPLQEIPLWKKYIYKFDEGDWKHSIDNGLVLLGNNKGQKTLKIKENYSNLLFKSDKNEYKLILKQVWYKTYQFISLHIAILLTCVYLIFNYYNQNKIYKSKVSELEMESLRSQMNPHFISNALNSINYYILENKTDEASLFIIKFSKLIRKILNNTSKDFICLSEELESLKMYIEMEKMRFKDKFTYNIDVDANVDVSYEVPSLILQPIVENAIWHGLMQKKSTGHLSICVKNLNKQIQVIIKDDGIGIERSKELKSKQSLKRKSFGHNIVTRRLELLNKANFNKYSITYEKYKPEEIQNPGTLVKLNL